MQSKLSDALADVLGKSEHQQQKQRAIVAGWFSYADRKATFGDIKARDVVCEWLSDANIPFDVAGDQSYQIDGVDINKVSPKAYTIFIFVCGPWQLQKPILERFQHCMKIGVNLSITNEGNEGFDYLIPRDSPSARNPDIVFAAKTSLVPVMGIVLVHSQPMYG